MGEGQTRANQHRPIAHLARITLYPIKSFDGIDVEQATLLAGGNLEHDRRFALFDQQGAFINGKRFDAVHRLRSHIDPVGRVVKLAVADDATGGEDRTFHLDADRPALEAWLGNYFGLQKPVHLAENAETGFPDDIAASGPTVVSTATLETVAQWFPGLSLAEVRRRFRANLEIGGVEPFWEDRLYGEADQVVRFEMGGAALEGVNPCQRCVVPSRDSSTGGVMPHFAKQFSLRRQQSLPPWSAASRFDHYYRLAVNTCAAHGNTGRRIRIGAPIRIVGTFSEGK